MAKTKDATPTEVFTSRTAGSTGEACRHERERVFEALQAGRVISFEWHLATDVVMRSPNANTLFGPDTSTDTGRGFFSQVHEEDREELTTKIQSLTRAKAEYTASYRYIRRSDGKELVLEERGRGEFDGSGKLVRLRGLARDVTEQKGTEAALREREAVFRLMFSESHVGKAEADPVTGRFLAVNAALCRITGYSEAELLQRTFTEITHPDEQATDWERFRNLVSSGINGHTCEKRYRRRDGGVTWAEVTVTLIRDAAGRPVRSFAVIQDITARKRAEEELRADLRALTKLHELSVRRLAGGDLRLLLQQIMEAAVVIMGADKGSLQLFEQNSLRIVAHHNQSAEFLKFFESAENVAASCGEAARRGQRVVVPDIQTSSIFAGTPSLETLRASGISSVQSTPILSRTGQLLGMLSTHWCRPHSPGEHDLLRIDLLVRQAADLIDQAKVEQALRASERLFRDTFEHSAIGIGHVGLDGRWLRVNGAYSRMLGYSPEELMKLTFGDITHPDDLELDWNYARQLLAGEIPSYSMEKRYIRKDGSLVWANLTGVLVRNDQGLPDYFIGAAADISDRKQMEETLRESDERLRQAVELVGLCTYTWKPQSGYLVWDAGIKPMWGLPPDATINYDVWRAGIHPADLPMVEERVARSLDPNGDGIYEAEYRVNGADGVERWISTRGRTTFEQGKPSVHWGVVVNITSRKRAEETVRRARERSELLSRTISRLLASRDPQSIVQELCDDVRQFLKCEVFFNFLLDRESGRLRLNACGGVDRRLARKVEDLELGQSLCGTAARDACRIHATNLFATDDPRSGLVRSLGIRAYACHPLMGTEQQVLGTLSFGAGDRDSFSAEDLELMRSVTDHVAIAMLRRRSEQALQEALERNQQQVRLFEGVASTTPDFVYLFDREGRFIYANRRLLDVWGMKLPEVLGKTFRELGYEPWHHDLHMREIAQVIETKRPIKGEVPFKAARTQISGVYEYIFAPVIGPGGEVEVIAGTTRDVTERKRAEETLRESEERFRMLANGTPVLIWVHDETGGLRFVNRAWAEFFGVTLEEAAGDKWRPLLHPEDGGYAQGFAKCHSERREFKGQARVRRADGEWRWVESVGVPRFGASGEFLGMAGSSVDITDRKAAEAVLARDRSELEELVRDRTAKLQDLVNELEHFSYTITHDMRAPLRAMRGLAEIMTDTDGELSDQERTKFTRRIITAAERMDGLITDALQYSRLMRQELPVGPVDLQKLLHGMLETYPEFQTLNADIRIEALPRVMGNEAGLTQCFSNLLGNAVKFAKPAQRPEVRVWSEAGEEDWVKVWVEDKGVGISEGMLPRVFDMFARGSSPQAGTGIGLALVRKVVDRMGGQVGVESEEGKGSRFWVQLRAGVRSGVDGRQG